MIYKKLSCGLLIFLIFVFFGGLFGNKKPLIKAEEDNLPICYQQNDPRWGSHMNGGGSIASSACGLLSVTNSINYLTGNFINPIELADYAYSIHAYNIPEGGGTWRDLFYHRLQDFEEKYGFKVVKSSIYADVTDKRLREHLMTGGVSICHVYGHFIAVVAYDNINDLYLVYDSAASSSRNTYPRGTWLTPKQLSEGKMDIDWFCLISKTREHESKLYGYENKANGRCELSLVKAINDPENFVVSGYVKSDHPMKKYYYSMGRIDSFEKEIFDTKYELSFVKNIEEGYDGFTGVLKPAGLTKGTYYFFIYGVDEENHYTNVAQIEVIFTNDDYPVLEENNVETTINKDMQKNKALNIGNYDLSKITILEVVTSKNDINLNLQTSDGLNKGFIANKIINKDKMNELDNIIFDVNELNYFGPVYLFNKAEDVRIEKVIVYGKSHYSYYTNPNENTHTELLGLKDNKPVYIEQNHNLLNDKLNPKCLEEGYDRTWCSDCGFYTKNLVLEAPGHQCEEYSYNDEGHYHLCDVCLEEYDHASHSVEIKSNAKRHYKYCTICGYEFDFEVHHFNETTGICSECGLKDPNFKEVIEDEKPNEDPVIDQPTNDNNINNNTEKKGCKKNSVIEIIELTSLVSIVYLFIRKH